jgi:diacylglycerol kinase family enzyme
VIPQSAIPFGPPGSLPDELSSTGELMGRSLGWGGGARCSIHRLALTDGGTGPAVPAAPGTWALGGVGRGRTVEVDLDEGEGNAKDREAAERQRVGPRWAAVPPPKRPVLFVNPRSGGGKAERTGLAQRARERAVEVVMLGGHRPLDELVEDAVAGGADVLGMAGGDGSLATVAAAASRLDLPFVCIPAGTRNHFARDVGVDPRDPIGALDAFGDAVERRIDTAEVNGRLFLNNVSLGIYGDAVRRAGYRDAKLRTLLETVDEVLGPGRATAEMQLVDDQGQEHSDPAIVLVSNNPYAFESGLPARGGRPVLDGGVLGVLVVDASPKPPNPPGRTWASRALEIRASGPLHVGLDGEAVDLQPPLSFRARARSLRVRVSARHAAAFRRTPLPLPGAPPSWPELSGSAS